MDVATSLALQSVVSISGRGWCNVRRRVGMRRVFGGLALGDRAVFIHSWHVFWDGFERGCTDGGENCGSVGCAA